MRLPRDGHLSRPMAVRERCRPRGAQAASSTGACGRALPSPSLPAARAQGGRGRPRRQVTARLSAPSANGSAAGAGAAAAAGRRWPGGFSPVAAASAGSMLAPAALPAAGLFYWVGALGVLYTAVLCAFRLLSGLRVWVLGGGRAVGPQLGAWAGGCARRGGGGSAFCPSARVGGGVEDGRGGLEGRRWASVGLRARSGPPRSPLALRPPTPPAPKRR